MTLSRRLGRRDQRADAGTTLIELLVTMVVFSLLGVAMTITVTAMTRQSTNTDQRLTAIQQAQTTVDHMAREIRAAVPQSTTPASAFTYAGATEMTLISSLGNATGPSLVDLNEVSGNLQESITKADAGGVTWTGTPTVKILATGVTGSTSLFTYYSNTGSVLPTPMATATATNAIDHILITLVVQESDLSGPITVSSTIYPRDVEYTS